MKVWMKVCAFLLLLGMSGLNSYAADDDIIEFLGDRYVIRVDKMNPDSEMTLLDVLNTCPEYLSIHGKKIDQVYTLRIDNIDLYVDGETFLANVKAREIDYIQITNNSSVAKSVAGTKGVIDVYYRQDIKTDGKVSLSGSTYGNGMAYADIKGSTEKLTVQAYALARSSYGKSYQPWSHRHPTRLQTLYRHGLVLRPYFQKRCHSLCRDWSRLHEQLQ